MTRIELFRSYLRYEYIVSNNLEFFFSAENTLIKNNAIKFGMTLDVWGWFKFKFGVEMNPDSSRFYVG